MSSVWVSLHGCKLLSFTNPEMLLLLTRICLIKASNRSKHERSKIASHLYILYTVSYLFTNEDN